jgi:hypothetical protein
MVEALMHVSLKMTESCVENMEANQEKVETKMESCLQGMEVGTIGARTTSDRL